MRIALDIDGTIDEHPAFFAFLSAALHDSGHTVLVLTYRDPQRRKQAEDQLAGWASSSTNYTSRTCWPTRAVSAASWRWTSSSTTRTSASSAWTNAHWC